MKQVAFAALLTFALTLPAQGGSYDDLNTGIQRYNLGEWNDAIAAFDKALAAKDLIPDQVFIAHYDRGQAHLALSQFDQAIEDYSASLAIRPGEVQVLLDRSALYLGTGKLDQALADLDGLVAAHPELIDPHRGRAIIYVKRGEIDKIRGEAKAILKLLPEDAPRGVATGILNWEAGRMNDAANDFSYEVSHGPQNLYAWLWYALDEARLGKLMPRDSLPHFEAKSWPGPVISFFLGDTSQEEVFTAAQEGDDQLVRRQTCEANFYIGEWLAQRHDPAGSKPLITKAAHICSDNLAEWAAAQMDHAESP